MKKTLITLAALAMASVANAAVTSGTGTLATPISSANWTCTSDLESGLATYESTITGAFDISLGDAAIKNGESFILEVTTVSSGWGNPWGTGFLSTNDALSNANSANQFTIYVGSDTNKKATLYMNTWLYDMADLNYDNVPETLSKESPLTLSFSIKWDKTAGAFTFASGTESDVQGTPYVKDTDIVTTFNFSQLTNIGQPLTAGKPDGDKLFAPDVVTTIKITKAIPEPTTATLSLLALAGLAARRRRK